MRVLKTCMMVALVLAIAAPAMAITLVYEEGPNVGQSYIGPITMKFTDYSAGTTYAMGQPTLPGMYSGNPNAALEAVGAGVMNSVQTAQALGALPLGPYGGLEDNWGILRVTRIQDPSGYALWTPAVKGQELTGLYWGGEDIWTDPMSPQNQRVDSVGFHVDLYSNPLGSFNPALGTANRTALNTYPSITTGVLEFSAVALQGFINAPGVGAGLATAHETRFNFTALTGDGDAFLELTGAGNSFVQFNTDTFVSSNAALLAALGLDTTADIRIEFETDPNVIADWLVVSDDPAKANVIPEPVTMLGLLFGAVGVGGYLRRRRAA